MTPNRLNSLTTTINEFLKEDIFTNEELTLLILEKLDKGEDINTETLNCSSNDTYISFLNYSGSNWKNKLEIEISEKCKKIQKTIKFYIFFENFSDVTKFEKDTSLKQNLKSKYKTIFQTITTFDIIPIFLPNITDPHSYSISIDSYLKRIDNSICINNSDGNNKEKTEGFVCTAKLEDIIKIYNDLGDNLFGKNVRCKIKDSIGVDSAIEKTLKEEPEKFWFFNNGITILIRKKVFSNPLENAIHIKVENNDDVSIINGAQTVSVSSLLYYSDDSIKEQIAKAFVLLRVIYKEEYNTSFCDDITVSLNRQKPIRKSDMHYFSPTVENINSINLQGKNKKYKFIILRNGEKTYIKDSLDLELFAKLFAIYYLQTPGLARTSKSKIFDDPKIWCEYLIKKDNENEFLKKFKPMNEAVKIYPKAHKILSDMADDDDPDEYNICKNGTDFFIGYFFWHFNNRVINDFSNWNIQNDVSDKFLTKLLSEYIKLLKEFCEEKLETPDSNFFKKDSMYNNVRDYFDKKKIWKTLKTK